MSLALKSLCRSIVINVTRDITQCWAAMIIEALVRIELKSNGTWEICDLKPVSDTIPPDNRPPKPKPGVVEKHFRNRDRIRKKRAREKSRVPHHCSECGLAHRNKVTHPDHMIELADRYPN